MIDYIELCNRMQRELALRYTQRRDLLNLPGRSLACKLDPFYYLAMYPGLLAPLARWAATMPNRAEEALIKTGSLILGGHERKPWLVLQVSWADGRRRARFKACFLHSSFVDRAVQLYAGLAEPPVSDLRIDAAHREKVQRFLEGKTEVLGLAFG